MTKRTYEVEIHASALRTIKVRASSGREALDVASERIGSLRPGPWIIDFPGDASEHFDVHLDGVGMGPNLDGSFDDEEAETDGDD